MGLIRASIGGREKDKRRLRLLFTERGAADSLAISLQNGFHVNFYKYDDIKSVIGTSVLPIDFQAVLPERETLEEFL